MIKYILCTIIICLSISKSYAADPLAATFNYLPKVAKKEISCLADNIYYEARAEPLLGQKAVALVTMNRLNNDKYPNTVCSVVKQKTENVCQFSWVCERRTAGKNVDQYSNAMGLAIFIYYNYKELTDVTRGALFFHATRISPKWKYAMQRTITIGNHVFYKI